jgi:hypothetical protein
MDELARVALAFGVVPPVVLEFPGITGTRGISFPLPLREKKSARTESKIWKKICFFKTR